MSIINENNSLLLIIDIQDKLVKAANNNDNMITNAAIMSEASNILSIPTIITEQYPKGLGNTIPTVKNKLTFDAKYFEKTSFSAIDNPEILNSIKDTNRKQIMIMGIETHICVSQTALALASQGYDIYIIEDACSSRSEYQHLAGINRMRDNNISIITTEIALFELLKDAKHPNFKEVQSLIK